VLENEDNIAGHLRRGFDAQWNDDSHHALHVLLTGETRGYYQDFADQPAALLARALSEGFIYQGQASANRQGSPRGEHSGDLPPSAFVSFLQNHDQTGNRAFGERLVALANTAALKAVVALQLLAPQIPLIFMGEEIGSRAPFLYFTDHEPALAQAVREGRAKEFAAFADAAAGRDIPDPNATASFVASRPERNAPDPDGWRTHYRKLLALRRQWVVPGIDGARALSATAVGDKAVTARWHLGNGAILTLALNLGAVAVAADLPLGRPFWGEPAKVIPAYQTLAWLDR
jgi:maltooligosyltrehalose trehalohydrolase